MSKILNNIHSFTQDYPHLTNKDLAKKYGVSIYTVAKWGSKLKLGKKGHNYRNPQLISVQEENLIKKFYPNGDLGELSKLLNKNRHAISELARKRGISREVQLQRHGTLEPLFSGTLESFYWLGFIAADGYVSKTGHLLVSQASKDKPIISRLAVFLETNLYTIIGKSNGYTQKKDSYRVNIADKVLGIKLRQMFGVRDDKPKTYTGISLDFIYNTDQAVSFLLGFIDGDGSLTSVLSYRIECHESWYNTFVELMFKKQKLLSDKEFNLRVSYRRNMKKNTLKLSIHKSGSDHLRQFAKTNHIPASDRKFLACE